MDSLENKDQFNFEFYLESIPNSIFIENSAEYTSDGKYIKSVTDTRLHKTEYNIDSTTGLMNSVTNAKKQTTNYSYNDKRQLTTVTTGDRSVVYHYNNQNLLSKITQENRVYNFEYDDFLNMKSVKIGDNITLITNVYEENNGNLISSTYGNNDSITYEYDEFDRIKKVNKMNDSYEYFYGNNGDLLKIKSKNNTIKYTYDSGKRLYEYINSGFKIKYGYDSNDNIISKKYVLDNIEHNIENILDDDDILTQTNFDSEKTVVYYPDNIGRITGKRIGTGNGLTKYEYVTNGKRTSLLIKSVDNMGDIYSYKYDKLDNITHIYHNNRLENRYYYDDYNELVKEDNYVINKTIVYVYDKLGNILSKKVYTLGKDDLVAQDTYEYSNSNWKDQLTKFNDDVITYDEIGNPLTIGDSITLDWINGRQLNRYTDSNHTIEYQYNEDGIRTSKTVDNIKTEYYVEGTSIIFERTGNNVIYYLRNETDGLIGLQYNNEIYYYMKNAQNDIIGILDSNDNVVVRYTYDSWGNIVSITDNEGYDISNDSTHIANINLFRYRSYYYDSETNLYYLNSRYYNPVWGRFINGDSYGGEIGGNLLLHNVYAYTLNNPINNVDSNGKIPFAIPLIPAIIGWGIAIYAASKALPSIVAGVADVISNPFLNPPKSHVKPKEDTKADVQVKPVVPYAPTYEEPKPCTTAKIVGGDVARGDRLTILESKNYVKFGGDVMCDNKNSALSVAVHFDDYFYHNPHRNGATGYYPHYHPWDGPKHPHIWFYPTS